MEPCEPARIDETLHELNLHGTAQFPFQCFYSYYGGREDDCFPGHWHQEVEMIAVDSGEARCLIGNERIVLHKGQGLFIPPCVIHGYETPNRLVMPTLLFKPELIAPEGSALHTKYVEPLLLANLSHAVLNPESPWQADLIDAIRTLSELAPSGSPTLELEVHTLVCGLWTTLFHHQGEIKSMGKTDNATLVQARLRKMITHIEENFSYKLRLEDIARAASVSVSEALRCFREGVHTTPIDYLNQYRLKYARARLTSTSLTITEIASECGFSSAAYFDRMFQRSFAVHPTAYRRLHGGRSA